MCMIFHKKFFQLVTAPIPLFQTPQKIGLLSLEGFYVFPIVPWACFGMLGHAWACLGMLGFMFYMLHF